MTTGTIDTVLDNVQNIPSRNGNRRKAVSIFAGWNFIRFNEGDAESFPIIPVYGFSGPVFEYNPRCMSLDHLESPMNAMLWLPQALDQLCAMVLAHAMGDTVEYSGKLKGPGWDAFRDELCKHSNCSMAALVEQAKSNGYENTWRYMTQCIYMESGLHGVLLARLEGRSILRTA